MAGDRPPPYESRQHGGGQAPALRTSGMASRRDLLVSMHICDQAIANYREGKAGAR